jgi:RNA polymerase sigma-70 factor, ECF subfamily
VAPLVLPPQGDERATPGGLRALSDEELVARYGQAPGAEGARALLEELFRRHRAEVVAWCYRLTGDRALAPDLAQDVLARAYASLQGFRHDSKFTTWLYVIARNRCRDEQRARAVRPREVPEDSLVDPPSEENAALLALGARDTKNRVRAIMEAVLDETERRVMTLHYGHDMGLDAITAALGLTNASGAKAYIVSAKRKLAAAMKRWTVKS